MDASEIPAPLLALAGAIDAMETAAADVADAELQRRTTAIAAMLPGRAVRFWQLHGLETLEIDPPLAEGLRVQTDAPDLEKALPHLPADLRPAAEAGLALMRLAAWSVERFNREAGEVLPDPQT